MSYKKKATPGTVQFNQLAAEIPEKQERLKHMFTSDMIF